MSKLTLLTFFIGLHIMITINFKYIVIMEIQDKLSGGIKQKMFEGDIVAAGITSEGLGYEVFEITDEFPDFGFRKEVLTKYANGKSSLEISVRKMDPEAKVLIDQKSSKIFNPQGVEVSSTLDEMSSDGNGSEHSVTEVVKSPDGKKNVSYFRKVRVAGSDKYDFHRINYKNGIPSEEIRVSEGNMAGSVTLFDKDGKIEKRSVTRNVGGFEIKAIYDSAGKIVSHTKTPLKKAN